MDKRGLAKITALKKEIHDLLCNQLVFPKTILGLLRTRNVTEDTLFRMCETIDRSIRMIDAKFDDLILNEERNKIRKERETFIKGSF